MSILKASIVAAALVAGFSTFANAAPQHHRTIHSEMAQPYNYSYGTLPYAEPEGRPVAAPFGEAGSDANTRAAEAFQDHFRNGY
jgi:hypothetical protein